MSARRKVGGHFFCACRFVSFDLDKLIINEIPIKLIKCVVFTPQNFSITFVICEKLKNKRVIF